jgi:predicted GNAT family N-acyltransferase
MKTNDSSGLSAGEYGRGYAVAHPDGGEFWIRPALASEIADLHGLIALEISSQVGPLSAMEDVFATNSVSFWRIERALPETDAIEPIGMYGFLPLNQKGCEAFHAGTLNRRTPDLAHVAPEGTKPAALYVWAVVAKRIGRLTYPIIKRALGPSYLDVPVFAVPATKSGARAISERGFVPVGAGQNGVGGLAVLSNTSALVVGSSRRPSLNVVVASNAEHLQMDAYIRGATFGAEQRCPYNEEFDDNDYCAMHLIGFVDGEPSASLRIRFFASFAKLERLAVIERFRKTEIKTIVMNRAIEICRRKGYRRLYGQSQERLVGFYAKFGFRPMKKNRPFSFSDHSYVEIERDLAPHEEALTMDSDPYAIIRPEGRWDEAGVLERSAARAPTNPH